MAVNGKGLDLGESTHILEESPSVIPGASLTAMFPVSLSECSVHIGLLCICILHSHDRNLQHLISFI